VTWRALSKTIVEMAIHRDLEIIEPNAVAVIDPRQRRQAWFCYDLQLQWLLQTNHVDLVVDVGANEGQFARRLRRIYGGDIISVEPVSAAFARLSAAADRDPRWTVYQSALGSADATATIHVCSDTAFSSLLVPNEFSHKRFPPSAVQSEEVVRVRRLDDLLAELAGDGVAQRHLFLKLDTQGCDLEVFGGLGACAASVNVLQSEVSLVPIYDGMPHWTDSIERYEEAGFSVAGMFPVNRTKTGRVIEYDCVLVREAGV
jgi:FkbM family methyltransferase